MDQAEHLRKMVQQTEQKRNVRVITITSGKGGVGKSSLAINLAIQLSRLGKKVVVKVKYLSRLIRICFRGYLSPSTTRYIKKYIRTTP